MFRSARRGRLAAGLLLASLVGGSLATGPHPASAHSSDEVGHDPHKYVNPHAGYVAPPRATGKLVPQTGSLMGTHSDDSHSGPLDATAQKILETEAALGRQLDIANSYYQNFDDIADDYVPGSPTKRGLSRTDIWHGENGRIPLVGWGCKNTTSAAVARGDKDDSIRKTAQAMRDVKFEFFMRYCWEMDGDKRTSYVGDPEDFRAAWIRIWTIFQEEGATNVVFVWCGNANSFKNKNSKNAWAWDYYPGDEYVDWVSADGYNWGASDRNAGLRNDRWRGMVEIYDEFMVWARSAGPIPGDVVTEDNLAYTEYPLKRTAKPIMIGEYGVQDPTGEVKEALEVVAPYNTKPNWLIEAHDALNGHRTRSADCDWCGIYSDVAAIVYFDIIGPNGDWRILSSPESVEAYQQAALDPWFNQIHNIGWAPAAVRADKPAVVPPPPPPVDDTPPTTTPTTTTPPVAGNGDGGGGGTATPVVNTKSGKAGYWMLGADGNVYAFGESKHLGNATTPVAADVEPTPSGNGYWIIDANGAVYGQGDAKYFGGIEAAKLAAGEKVTSLSATPSGKGYWIFTSLGRVAPFGDAFGYGDLSKIKLNGPVLDSIATPTGRGYYMVGSDGGIFAFGDATFHGSLGNMKLNAPVQSLVPTADGRGYWLVASDGGIFAFGNAPFRGSLGSTKLNKPMTGMVPFGNGYLMVGEDGGIFNFSDKDFLGSLGATKLPAPVVAVAALD